jgi:hypothetical protein
MFLNESNIIISRKGAGIFICVGRGGGGNIGMTGGNSVGKCGSSGFCMSNSSSSNGSYRISLFPTILFFLL